MVLAAALLLGTVGVFALLWYRTLLRLPARRRPQFFSHPMFRYGVPAASAILLSFSLYIIARKSITIAIVCAVTAATAALLIAGFDRCSAEMRIIYDQYRKIRYANRAMGEFEVLYRTAAWRYPSWSEDRLVELVAGKDIQGLMVLMMIQENQINPLSDWELYRRLKSQAARIVAQRRGAQESERESQVSYRGGTG